MPAVRNWHVTAVSALFASSAVAVIPIASPSDFRVANLDVRLASSGEDLPGDAANLLSPLDSLTTFLATAGTDLSDLLDSGLTSINSSLGLAGIDLGGITNDLGVGLTSALGSLLGASGPDGSLQNIPYNLLANLLNIPYNESLALQEYAYALGPAGSVGGVPGWIPPGTGPDGVDAETGQYALGGTGSWWMESVGNTWGWDDGNWPQVDGIGSFLLPFKWAQSSADLVQGIMQAESIDGSHVNCEFECASILGYVGHWFQTPLTALFSPEYTYPTVVADTVGGTSATGVINTPQDVVWSGQQPDLNLMAPFTALWANLTASPASDPIEISNPLTVLTSASNLYGDLINDFDPFVTGSFLYWGAPTLDSVPAFLAGILHDLSGGIIPNPFAGLGDWQPNGAEPLSGYTDGPSSLVTGLPQGFEYLVQGLLAYLDPSTWGLGAGSADPGTVSSDPSALLAGLTGGSDSSTLSSDLSELLGSSGLAALFDPGTLSSDLSALVSNLF